MFHVEPIWELLPDLRFLQQLPGRGERRRWRLRILGTGGFGYRSERRGRGDWIGVDRGGVVV